MSDKTFNPFQKLGDEIQLPTEMNNNTEDKKDLTDEGIGNTNDVENTIETNGINIEKATISEKELEARLSENSMDLLKSKGVIDALQGESVDSVIVDKTNQIIQPNFVIDLENVELNPTIVTVQAIDGMIHPEGNTALYFLHDGKLILRGMGLNGLLNRILPRVVYNVFGPKAKLYGNFEVGKKVRLINESNILTKRMNI